MVCELTELEARSLRTRAKQQSDESSNEKL